MSDPEDGILGPEDEPAEIRLYPGPWRERRLAGLRVGRLAHQPAAGAAAEEGGADWSVTVTVGADASPKIVLSRQAARDLAGELSRAAAGGQTTDDG